MMTESEALDAVRRIISGTVLMFPDHLIANLEYPFLVGDRNANTLVAALQAAGWSWVQSRPVAATQTHQG